MINTRVNSIRHVHEEKEFVDVEDKDGISPLDLKNNISDLLENGLSKELIKESIIPHLGFKYNSLPEEIKTLLK